MSYLKQLGLSICLTSTIILWGVAFQFSNAEISTFAMAVAVFQWINYLQRDEK